jgi:hypothetical protein
LQQKNKKIAKEFSTKKGIVFEIIVNSGKFISPYFSSFV